MTVYVDDYYRQDGSKFGRMRMSHMIADTDEELHAMAAAIGMARRWFQGDHYDVSMSKRYEAIDRGAVQIPHTTCSLMVANRKAGWPFTVENAREIAKLRYALHNYLTAASDRPHSA